MCRSVRAPSFDRGHRRWIPPAAAMAVLLTDLWDSSDHRDLHAVDRRERVEQAAPVLAPIAAHPELTRRGPEVERGRAELVDVHRVALDGEEALLLRQPAREPPPGVAPVLAAPAPGGPAGQ